MITDLTVLRHPSRNSFTPGELQWETEAGPQHECCTCEDEIRELPGVMAGSWKIPGATAIPEGRYRLVIDYSPKFSRDMPHVLDVPGFTGIRIHIGNYAKDTEGCLLLGQALTDQGVSGSTLAFHAFEAKLVQALKSGEVWISYRNPPPRIVT